MGNRQPDQPMRFPQHAQLSKREATFEQGWPELLSGKIPDLARAGFYYRGVKDNATCFHCGMTLENWDLEEDPYAEHAYWNPNCPYINQYKGRSWVMSIFVGDLDQQGYKPLPEIKPLLNPEPDVQLTQKYPFGLLNLASTDGAKLKGRSTQGTAAYVSTR
ncbi:baculoviral IAP repeat-containing protein 7-B-like [Saccostrea cucullata]|uniref:baculoviral IAP repeat-containing protein 7-B-like n=1 Tax=Saccostrea cuccullata TaxID=36930 RepID=UPI002ED4CF66